MELEFTAIGGPTFVINVNDQFKIGCDPALTPKAPVPEYKGMIPPRIADPVYTEDTFVNVKAWLLTHGHFDHLDDQGLNCIEKGSHVFSHENCAKILKARNDLTIQYMKWGQKESLSILDHEIEVEAIPAVHGHNFITRTLMGGVNGYLLTIRHGKEMKTIYVTSDTIFSDDIIQALHERPIDLLIANMGQARLKFFGGPITMDVDMLNKFIEALHPGFVLPIHIDDYAHFETSRKSLKSLEKRNNVLVLENGKSIRI